MIKEGIEVFPDRKFEVKPGSHEWSLLTEDEKMIFSLPSDKQRIGMIETTPFNFHSLNTEIKIANTMCESDSIGEEWVKATNRMDYVVVPNEWNKKVFERSGVTRPITVIPHGHEIDRLAYYDRPEREIFTFGIVGYLNDRKGVFETIRAFASEFAPDEPVRLYLKTSNKEFAYYQNFSDPRIITDARHLPFDELVKLYHSFDCFVFPSKAEGVGNPPREAALTGCPVITTNYSGLEDLCQTGYVYALEPKEVKRRDMQAQPGNWAEIDLAELMGAMRHVYEHKYEANYNARLLAQHLRDEYSWDVVGKKMADFLRSIDK